MLECNVILTIFAHYAYMVTFTLFMCLIQIQNTEICTVYRKSANMKRYEFLLKLSSPTLKKCAFGNI